MPDYVSLKELAKELGIDRSGLRRYVLKSGIVPVNIRTADSRSQLTLALHVDDAEAIRQLRQKQGFGVVKFAPVENTNGCFYVIQLVPDLDPNRVKLGFANDVMTRLSAHQTAAPTATLLKAWSCKRSWEGPIIEGVTRIGCRLISNEVYECEDLEALVKRCDEFFRFISPVHEN